MDLSQFTIGQASLEPNTAELIPPRPNMEYFLSQDNSGHWVLVPQPIRPWWFKYLEFPEDDERSWVYPEGCIQVDGPEKIVFSDFRSL